MKQAILIAIVLSTVVLGSVTGAGAASGDARSGRVLFSETTPYAYGYGSLYAMNPNGSGRVGKTAQLSAGARPTRLKRFSPSA